MQPRQVVEEFDKLERELLELGGATGLAEYKQILRECGVNRPDQFESSQPARLCARRVFDLIESLRANGGASIAIEPADNREGAEVAYGD